MRRRPRARPGVTRGGRSTLGLPSDALTELDRGCRLGVGVAVTRSGSGSVPQRRPAGGCDVRRRGGFAEVDEDMAAGGRIGDEHGAPLSSALRATPSATGLAGENDGLARSLDAFVGFQARARRKR